MISKSFNTVVGDPLCFFWVDDEIFDFSFKIREVSLHFDEILVGTTRDEKIVVMLDPLHFVNNNHRVAYLTILQRCRVTSTCHEVRMDNITRRDQW